MEKTSWNKGKPSNLGFREHRIVSLVNFGLMDMEIFLK